LLDYCIVLGFFVWVKLVAFVLVPAIILVPGVCCCVSRVLKAMGTAFFSFLRQKVSVSSWKTLCALRAWKEEVCDKSRSNSWIYILVVLVAFCEGIKNVLFFLEDVIFLLCSCSCSKC